VLNGINEGIGLATQIAVAREDYHVVEREGEVEHIGRHLDGHAATLARHQNL